MDERGGLERDRRRFAVEFRSGKFAKLVVHEPKEFLGDVLIALLHFAQDESDTTHGNRRRGLGWPRPEGRGKVEAAWKHGNFRADRNDHDEVPQGST